MGKYIRLTKPYLIVVTLFVVLRFVLEVMGVSEKVTGEISLTRVMFILPIFLGLRFAREGRGFSEMLAANFVYSFWGVFLVMIVTVMDVQLVLNTHYGVAEGMSLGGHLLGHIVEIIVFTIVGSVLSLITAKLSGGEAAQSAAA